MREIVLPDRAFSAYIFDCDGTLVDSMPVHFRAWQAVLQQRGLPGLLSEELFYNLGGVPTPRIVEVLNERHGTALDPEEICREKEEAYEAVLPAVRRIEPVVAIAREAVGRWPMAVASGGIRRIVRRTLELAGIADLFPVVVTADDVAEGKPAPDMFLLAARRMEVSAAECLVFEDSPLGIEAARRAGMAVVEIPAPDRRSD
jgi:beta-phosphoglucomutase family hydrolase